MNPKIKGLKKYTVLLNTKELEKAQSKAVNYLGPKTAGNTSAFIRWLVADFLDLSTTIDPEQAGQMRFGCAAKIEIPDEMDNIPEEIKQEAKKPAKKTHASKKKPRKSAHSD